jgi:UDPglucose--hexose-1-phosphate uridylyltransferase
MSELRYNLVSDEWVVVATERAKRPQDFVKATVKKEVLPEHKPDCPLCLGNENMTPPEVFRIGGKDAWKVRVVYNKYAALSPQGEMSRKSSGVYRSCNGIGVHEVIVEHPLHNACIPLLKEKEVADIVKAYQNRYAEVRKDTRFEAIIIFKNNGPSAGTSLEHSHSQLIATPVVPPQLRKRMEQAIKFFASTGSCLLCRTVDEELQAQARIVFENKTFVSFMPYAALSPFHLWIVPKRHMGSFDEMDEAEVMDLAHILKVILGKLYNGLANPDYNFTLHSLPLKERRTKYFHWYISVIPRVSQLAGFELGSGMFINSALPEESAAFLRQVT